MVNGKRVESIANIELRVLLTSIRKTKWLKQVVILKKVMHNIVHC